MVSTLLKHSSVFPGPKDDLCAIVRRADFQRLLHPAHREYVRNQFIHDRGSGDHLHDLEAPFEIIVPLPPNHDAFTDEIGAGLDRQILVAFPDNRDLTLAPDGIDAEPLGFDSA